MADPLRSDGDDKWFGQAPSAVPRGNGRTYNHDLAEEYNRRLAETSPTRAAEIEWYVTPGGALRLGDRPEWSVRRTAKMDRAREAERQEWLRRHEEGQYSDPSASFAQ